MANTELSVKRGRERPPKVKTGGRCRRRKVSAVEDEVEEEAVKTGEYPDGREIGKLRSGKWRGRGIKGKGGLHYPSSV